MSYTSAAALDSVLRTTMYNFQSEKPNLTLLINQITPHEKAKSANFIMLSSLKNVQTFIIIGSIGAFTHF
jgi:hypothetical protein